ncbi:MAG: 6-phosphogluconolactonase [Gaiellales bacterium]
MSTDLEVVADPAAVAQRGAAVIADRACSAVDDRGAFSLAVSGGHTPVAMFAALGDLDLPWDAISIYQVDERIAPPGDDDRNLTQLMASLPEPARRRVNPMPVEAAEVAAAAAEYAAALPALDLVHLGIGDDGHTASLVPGDPVLDVADRAVAVTGEYRGRRRMTLTYPPIDAAAEVLWIVAGASKRDPVAKLLAHDPSVPAGRVAAERMLVLADRAAAG